MFRPKKVVENNSYEEPTEDEDQCKAYVTISYGLNTPWFKVTLDEKRALDLYNQIKDRMEKGEKYFEFEIGGIEGQRDKILIDLKEVKRLSLAYSDEEFEEENIETSEDDEE